MHYGRTLLALTAIFVSLVTTTQAVNFDYVTVGNAGNVADTTGFGAVSYEYKIGKTEVTYGQYAEFLNAVAVADTNDLYTPNMTVGFAAGIDRGGSPGSFTYSTQPGRENHPVAYISFFDSLRFSNWLNNGQPTGPQDASTTEDGAYTFTGPTSVGNRNPNATVFLPSEDEW